MMGEETYKRPKGCVCTHEEGDSDCPVHLSCPQCGSMLDETSTLMRELATLRARALPQAVVDAVRHCMSVANGPTVDRIDAMHALRHAIEADAKGGG